MNESKILCLDLGGTSLKCALIRGGKILKRFRVPTDAARGLEGILKTFRSALDRFADDGYEGIAVSSAGTVDSERGVVTYATALLPGYTGFALKDWFTAQTGKPCACVNDGYAAALCESASFGDVTCAVLTLGTGVGGAYVKNGEIDTIASQGIGHLCFRPEGRACTCGKRGCIEQYISGSALQKAAGNRPESLWQRYGEGDRETVSAVGDWLRDLRSACDFLYAFKPFSVVIFGGGVADDAASWLKPQVFADAPYRAVSAKYGNDAGVLGAYRFYRGVCG